MKVIVKLISSTIGIEQDDVDNVCWMYILLCFVVLYFPRNSKFVCNMSFRILDNLDTLVNYNGVGQFINFWLMD